MSERDANYGAVDIMNHAPEARRDIGTNPFEFEEFRIMTQTTFKSIFKGRKPDKDFLEQAQSLVGHATVSDCIADMDRLGYERIVVCATKMWSYRYHHRLILDYPVDALGEAVAESGGRLIGAASYNPFRIEQSLAEIVRAVKEYGFRYVWFHGLSFGLPPNDRRFYPLYAKCAELDIAIGFQVGHSAEVLPSEPGRPMLADDVAIDFPNLRINLSHTGWPWIDEWCSMLWRHPNVYGDISSYFPKHLDERTVRFMNSSRGRDKVMFGTNGFGLERCIQELISLPISEETKQAVLHDNAVRFLKLEDS